MFRSIPKDPNPVEVAAVGRRALACLLDVVLLGAVILAARWAWFRFVLGGERPSWLSSGPQIELFILLTVSLPVYLYFTLLEAGARQATLGKRWLGLKVTDMSEHRIGRGRALLRTFVKLIPWEITHLTLMLPTPIFDAGNEVALRPGFMFSTMLVGSWLATVMLTPKSQGVHDLLASTLVVPARAAPPATEVA